ncbi:MAG TPA: LamG-like jellyroll fold domain-containing protein [Planctomycetota bacterium]|nr:LamG-like jellyroll fold domain-containing protein [Planctomycetota bacterium]
MTTYDAATGIANLYVDGVPRGSAVYASSDANLAATWRLATKREDGSAGRCEGTYDNSAVYNDALTPEQVNALFYRAYDGVTTTNLPAFSSGLRHFHPMATNANDTWDGYNGTVTGGSWVVDNPPLNAGGWRKTANTNNVVLPMRVNLLEGTYEGWFKSSASAPDWSNPLATSIRATNEAHPSDSMRIEVTSTTNTNNTYIFDSPGAGTVTANFDTTDGLWHLIAFTYKDGESVKLYIDGLLRGESPGVYDVLLAYDRNLTMLGSRTASATTDWRGTVGTVAYYDFALSDADIAFHWQYGISEVLSTVIPEPATLSLLLVGLGAGLVRRRSRRVRQATGGN